MAERLIDTEAENDMFIFEGEKLSAVELIFALAERGTIYLDFKDAEKEGVRVST